jgi:hypothetical protein
MPRLCKIPSSTSSTASRPSRKNMTSSTIPINFCRSILETS